MWLVPARSRDTTRVPAPRLFLVMAALLVAPAVSMVALALSRSEPLGAIDSAGATWTISGRGSGGPIPKSVRFLGARPNCGPPVARALSRAYPILGWRATNAVVRPGIPVRLVPG